MKSFQIFLKDGNVRNIKADRVEVTLTEVVFHIENRVVEVYERSSVIMMDESTIEKAKTSAASSA